jgi:tetratricopeptide (TPR) repeat protein
MSQVTFQQSVQVAIGHYKAGHFRQAEEICGEILRQERDHPDAVYLLGIIALDTGKFAAAVQYLRRNVTMMPRFPYGNYKLGVALARLGNHDEAIAAFRRAIQLHGDFPEALNSLSMLLRRQGKMEEALAGFQKAAELDPERFEAQNNLGVALAESDRLEEAVAAFSKALRCRPDSAVTHRHLGKVMATQQRGQDAIAAFKKAVELKSDYADGYNDLGVALSDEGRPDKAIAAFREAIRLKPDLASARLHLALTLLLTGDFVGAWPEYEWRWQAEGFKSPRRPFVQPQWKGEELAGETILLHAEQGYGDTIQFVRYAEMVAARGGNVLLECHRKLTPALKGVAGIKEIIPTGQALPPFDVHCPLMSLPGVFNTTPNSIPASVPYLKPDPQLLEAWDKRLETSRPGFRVGLAWAGRPVHSGDKSRSMHLSALAHLAALEGVRFFSLQKGPAVEQADAPPAGMEIVNLDAQLLDFADTAAAISLMDLVISVDTAVVHLAGALAKPVWVMLPFVPDWRWQLEREDSPWYPTMRLFRQPALGDWGSVIDRVAEGLGAALESRDQR